MRNIYVFLNQGQDELLKIKAKTIVSSYTEGQVKNVYFIAVNNAIEAGFLLAQTTKIKAMWGMAQNNVYVYLDNLTPETNICVALLQDSSYVVSTIKNDFFYFVEHFVNNFFTYFTNGSNHNNFVNSLRVAAHLAIGQDSRLELEGAHSEIAQTGNLYQNIVTSVAANVIMTNILYEDLKEKHNLSSLIKIKLADVEYECKFLHEFYSGDLNINQIYKSEIYPSNEFVEIYLQKPAATLVLPGSAILII